MFKVFLHYDICEDFNCQEEMAIGGQLPAISGQ